MEFYAQKSDMLDELDLLQGAVEKKSTVPILSHFLLDAADFKLQIAATRLLPKSRRNHARTLLRSRPWPLKRI